MNWSNELSSVLDESHDIAERLNQSLTTAHLLLCLFTLENLASEFLGEMDVDLDLLLELVTGTQKKPFRESPETWNRVIERAEAAAKGTDAPWVTSLHVLVALCSFPDSAAYKLIGSVGLDLGMLRTTALAELLKYSAQITGTATAGTKPGSHSPGSPDQDTTLQVTLAHASSSDDQVQIRAAQPRSESQFSPESRNRFAEAPLQVPGAPNVPGTRPFRNTPNTQASGDTDSPFPRVWAPPSPTRQPGDMPLGLPPAEPGRPRQITPQETTLDLAKRVFETQRPWRPVMPDTLPLPPSVRRSANTPPPQPAVPERLTAPPSTPAFSRQSLTLPANQFPLLNQLGRNLTLAAFDGKIDLLVGREVELEQLLDILNKRRSNNPLLIGEAGVGKTAVVEGLARRLIGLDGPPPPRLAGRIIIELETSRILSGTAVRGSFSERIQGLKAEVERAQGKVIIFLDEIHHWMGSGAGDSAADGAGELKTALARGEFPCIGATTFDEYGRFVEGDPAFARRFQLVRVEEPSPAEAMEILQGILPTYESHHEVRYEPDALEAAIRLTHRYLPNRRLPDKAIAVLDHAGSRALRRGMESVDRAQIAGIVAELAGLPPDKLVLGDAERVAQLPARLAEHVVGHQDLIQRVSDTLQRNYAGFVSGRPMGVFLFLGPTGVGKTEFAKAITEVLFDGQGSMTRFDMSEFMEPHSVARFIGSAPGYVGHESGGQLTEKIQRRPYQLVLFDELEKAHPDVLNLLIQILDEGRLTDARGRTADFSNTVVVMTTNLGAEALGAAGSVRRVGFGAGEDTVSAASRVEDALNIAKAAFRPEIWNRIPERCVFLPLREEEVKAIAQLQLQNSSQRLFEERQIRYAWTPQVIDLLMRSGGYDPAYGARPMRGTIEKIVEGAIASVILKGEARSGDTILLDAQGEVLSLQIQ